MTLEELKKLYGEKGAMEQRVTQTEQGDQIDYVPVQLGDGWTAYENQPQIIGYEGQGMDATPIYAEPEDKLGGFQRSEGNKNYFYDTNGNLVHVEKQTTDWDVLGPIIMGAATMGGGAGMLGNSLFGLSGTAASTAGGALLGAGNAALTDKDILKGALLGGVSGAGGAEIGDTGFKVGDVTKAIKFAQNPSLLGAVSYLPGLTNSLSGFEANPDDFIPGYFLPGGEGYVPSELNKTYGPDETFNAGDTDWAALYADTSSGSPAGLNVADFPAQDFGVDPNQNWDSYMNTMNQISNKDGFGSQWQTLGTNRVMVNDDGGATVLDPTTQETSFLTKEQVDALVKNGSLNSEKSGYVAATGGKNGVPGGTPKDTKTATSTKKTAPSEDLMKALGSTNVVQPPMQDPYADIKLMEELFGPDIAYKLRALKSAEAKKPASSNTDAIMKLLRG